MALGTLSPARVPPAHGHTGTPNISHPTVTGWEVHELGKAGGGRASPSQALNCHALVNLCFQPPPTLLRSGLCAQS